MVKQHTEYDYKYTYVYNYILYVRINSISTKLCRMCTDRLIACVLGIHAHTLARLCILATF